MSELLFTYTRAQALADGFQVDVTTTAQEAGIKVPVFITRGVYSQYVQVPADVTGQDERGRLWDIVWMMRHAIRRAQPGRVRLPVLLYVRNSDRLPARLTKLIAMVGPVDIDNPAPAITVMLPDED